MSLRYLIPAVGTPITAEWIDDDLTVTIGSRTAIVLNSSATDDVHVGFDLAIDTRGHYWIVLAASLGRYRSDDGGRTWTRWSPA